MKVLSMKFIFTGTHEDVGLRPYQTRVTNNDIGILQETTQGGAIINAGTMAGLSGTVLTQAAQPEGIVQIVNGWGEQRLRFIMEIETQTTGQTRNRQIITGYTNYPGVNRGNLGVTIDPGMELIVNNNITLRDQRYTDVATGMVSIRSVMSDNSQILQGGHAVNNTGQLVNANNTFGLRPMDVFGNQAATAMAGNYGGGRVHDTRLTFNQGIRKSTRDNAIASRYLARSLHSMNLAKTNESLDDAPLNAVYQEAYQYSSENPLLQDQVFSVFNNRCAQFLSGGIITYGELCAVFTGLDNIVDVMFQTTAKQQSELAVRGQQQNWMGNDIGTVFATRIMSAVPGLMIENMMSSVGFTVTNETINGQFVVEFIPGSVNSFTQGLDMNQFMARFQADLVVHVLATLTNNSEINISFTSHFDVFGESRLWLSVLGEPQVPYTTASFSDALYTPMITTNLGVVGQIGHDIDIMVNSINLPGVPNDVTTPTIPQPFY